MSLFKILWALFFVSILPLTANSKNNIDFEKIKTCFQLTNFKIKAHNKLNGDVPATQFIETLPAKESPEKILPLDVLLVPDGDKLHVIQDIKKRAAFGGFGWSSLSTHAPVIKTFTYSPKKASCNTHTPPSTVSIGKKCWGSDCKATFLGFGLTKSTNGNSRACQPTVTNFETIRQAHSEGKVIKQPAVKKLIEKAISERLVFISKNMGKGILSVDYKKLSQATHRDGPCASAVGSSVLLASSSDLVVCPIDTSLGVNCPLTPDTSKHMTSSGEISAPVTD